MNLRFLARACIQVFRTFSLPGIFYPLRLDITTRKKKDSSRISRKNRGNEREVERCGKLLPITFAAITNTEENQELITMFLNYEYHCVQSLLDGKIMDIHRICGSWLIFFFSFFSFNRFLFCTRKLHRVQIIKNRRDIPESLFGCCAKKSELRNDEGLKKKEVRWQGHRP